MANSTERSAKQPLASDHPEASAGPMKLFTTTLLAVFIGELLVMYTLSLLPSLDPLEQAVLDLSMFLAFFTPTLYFLFLKPMRRRMESLEDAERALRTSEEQYRDVVEGTADLVTQVDENGNFTFVNEASKQIFGLEPDQCVGLSAFAFVHPDDRERTRRSFEEWIREGASHVAIENRQVSRTGEVRTLLWATTIHGDEATDSARLNGIARDITELRRMERALALSTDRARLMMVQSPAVIEFYDLDGVQVDVNEAYEELWGFPASHTVGIFNVLQSKEVEKVGLLEYVKRAYAGESVPVPEYEFDSTGPTEGRGIGRTRWLSTRIYPLKDAAGDVEGIVITHEDVTERKRAEDERGQLQAQLNQAQKMESVGRLAGGVAHDFNNMLSVILGHADLAMGRLDPSEPLYTDLQEIERAGQRSADLTRQLLAFARKQTVAPKILDLNDTVGSMTKMLRRLIGENVRLVWMPEAGLWPVEMDPTQVDQLLANLCVNARDAISGVGEVTIEVANVTFEEPASADNPYLRAGDFVMLAVSDNGCGIEDDVLGHIFEPFFTVKELGLGTGLGLSTVYGIVKQNGGIIRVDSEVEKGTTFKIYLPRSVGEVHETTGPAAGLMPGGRGEMVLLVEDEAAILRVGESMLKRLGYKVLTALTPGEALRIVESYSGEIHLLITDVVMPGMTGRELADRIAGHIPDLKTLFISGYTADVIAPHGVLEEGVRFLQKPFHLSGLAAGVREALREEIMDADRPGAPAG
jgi:PAS domain S-box-containing protein